MMLRHLYRVVLRLHPRAFRARFGDEMLSIFESTRGKSARFALLSDCVISSLRQWILRPNFRGKSIAEPHFAATDGIPSFSSLDNFRPRTSAVIDGIILSAALFAVTCFAIRYSWIRILHIQIPGDQAISYQQVHPASPSELKGTQRPEPPLPGKNEERSGLISEHLQVDVLPVEAGSPPVPSAVTRATSAIAPGQPPNMATEVTLQLPLEAFAGIYKARSPRMTIKIAVKNGRLSMHIVGESPRTLSPVSETEFAIAGSNDTRIEFLPAQNGEILGIRLSRGGQQITAARQ